MKKAEMSYDDKMHRTGRFWTAVMIVVMICIPGDICLIFKTLPAFDNPEFWKVFIPVLLMDILQVLVNFWRMLLYSEPVVLILDL